MIQVALGQSKFAAEVFRSKLGGSSSTQQQSASQQQDAPAPSTSTKTFPISVRALYDINSQRPNELILRRHELLTATQEVNADW
jgi:hypothetical protein